MGYALIVNHVDAMRELYECVLLRAGHQCISLDRPALARPIVGFLLERGIEPLLLIDCAKYEPELHRCVAEALDGIDVSRVHVLVTTDHPPVECDHARHSPFSHYQSCDVWSVEEWVCGRAALLLDCPAACRQWPR